MDFLSMMQNPAVRDAMLNKLAQSPIDPMQAMQQLSQGMGGGTPPAGMNPNANPAVNPGVQFGAGAPGVQFPPGSLPGGPQVPGLPPQAPTPVPKMGVQAGNLNFAGDSLVPGEPAGAAGAPIDPDMLKMSLMGLSGMQQNQPQMPWRGMPSTPGGFPTRQVDFKGLQTAPVGQRITLADLLYRGR